MESTQQNEHVQIQNQKDILAKQAKENLYKIGQFDEDILQEQEIQIKENLFRISQYNQEILQGWHQDSFEILNEIIKMPVQKQILSQKTKKKAKIPTQQSQGYYFPPNTHSQQIKNLTHYQQIKLDPKYKLHETQISPPQQDNIFIPEFPDPFTKKLTDNNYQLSLNTQKLKTAINPPKINFIQINSPLSCEKCFKILKKQSLNNSKYIKFNRTQKYAKQLNTVSNDIDKKKEIKQYIDKYQSIDQINRNYYKDLNQYLNKIESSEQNNRRSYQVPCDRPQTALLQDSFFDRRQSVFTINQSIMQQKKELNPKRDLRFFKNQDDQIQDLTTCNRFFKTQDQPTGIRPYTAIIEQPTQINVQLKTKPEQTPRPQSAITIAMKSQNPKREFYRKYSKIIQQQKNKFKLVFKFS